MHLPAHRFITPLIVAFVCACASSAGPAPGFDEPGVRSAPRMLARAIDRAGGAAALEAARALTWEGDAIVSAGARVVQITGTWAIQPPDTGVVATFDVTRGPESVRALVVAAPRGWLVNGTEFTTMPASMLANERDEFYLYDVMRLVPLREPGVTLTLLAPDSLGQAGFRAERAGRPAIELYFDGTGRLAHLRTHVADPAGGPAVKQDTWLSGVIESAGVRWPRDLHITLNGQPFFSLTLRTLRVHRRVEDARLKGPG